MILGIDEVGRGPWAGPLVVGAVVFPEGVMIEGLTDSKKLSEKRRTVLDAEIREKALGYGLGWVDAKEIDSIGLSKALRLATIRAVEAIKVPYHEIIIDGTINFLQDTTKGKYVTTLPKADALIPAVSAASIIAKVARDTYMAEQAVHYPKYGFASHVGYGTAAHQKALETHGVTPLHRTSFAPIKKLLESPQAPESMTPKRTQPTRGQRGEQIVADWLKMEGYEIIERNWKTKWCEIDVIAQKNNTIHFIEVKYRTSSEQGTGIEAITPKKLQQMKFAAELYVSNNHNQMTGQLMVAGVDNTGTITLLKVE